MNTLKHFKDMNKCLNEGHENTKVELINEKVQDMKAVLKMKSITKRKQIKIKHK